MMTGIISELLTKRPGSTVIEEESCPAAFLQHLSALQDKGNPDVRVQAACDDPCPIPRG